jgi:hypothetical protein
MGVPIPDLSACPVCPGVSEPIFVAILFDQPRKNRAMMQKANVGHPSQKMDKIVRRERVTIHTSARSFVRSFVRRRSHDIVDGRIKGMKKLRRGKRVELCGK